MLLAILCCYYYYGHVFLRLSTWLSDIIDWSFTCVRLCDVLSTAFRAPLSIKSKELLRRLMDPVVCYGEIALGP